MPPPLPQAVDQVAAEVENGEIRQPLHDRDVVNFVMPQIEFFDGEKRRGARSSQHQFHRQHSLWQEEGVSGEGSQGKSQGRGSRKDVGQGEKKKKKKKKKKRKKRKKNKEKKIKKKKEEEEKKKEEKRHVVV